MMYKLKGIWVFMLLTVCTVTNAQISITPQVPPLGTLVKNQLWNMILINTSTGSIMVRINLVLLDEKSNQPVLTATTAPITINKGATQIQSKDLGAITYVYGDPSYHVDNNPNGLLPTGNFQACYTVQTAIKPVTVAQSCLQLNVDPLSPPILNTPRDSDKVYTFYPQFTWLPPTPIGIFNDLSYDMVLVEILPGQSPGDAVQDNIPLYNGAFLKNLYLNYPSSFRALDTGKIYAWRIVALNGTQPAAMSDIWTFRVVGPVLKGASVSPVPFVAVQRTMGAALATVGSTLKISYNNAAGDTSIQYTVHSLSDPGDPLVQYGTSHVKFGPNFLEIPLNQRFTSGKTYLLEFTNSRQETWNLKFSWSK
jgi:hypothetical protein